MSSLPSKNEDYGSKDYWETRYREEEHESASFDWFKKYDDIAHLIRDAVSDKASRILMLGCGNSTLSEDVS